MTRITVAITLALLFGCQKENPEFCATHPGEQDCPNGDGGSDAPPPMCDPAACPDPATQDCVDHVCVSRCFGEGKFELCLDALPTGAVTVPASIDTTNAPACAGTQPTWPNATGTPPQVCVIAGMTVSAPTAVSVIGTRPLVLVSLAAIDVGAVIDAASHVGGSTGPDSDETCPADGMPAENNNNGGGGGAGGSFIIKGGDGGNGDGGGGTAGTASTPLTTPITILRGGCKGQDGGQGSGNGGQAGFGGGAIYLAARTVITVAAASGINASGGGATGNAAAAGGGGGGSGGMIVLSAPQITLAADAFLMANGGGGAAGGGSAKGGDGFDPTTVDVTVGGAGGSGGGGGAGGDGSASNAVAQAGGPAGGGKGGGGGGGGPGLIYATGLTGGRVAPGVTATP
jgi:hypothetical protein